MVLFYLTTLINLFLIQDIYNLLKIFKFSIFYLINYYYKYDFYDKKYYKKFLSISQISEDIQII